MLWPQQQPGPDPTARGTGAHGPAESGTFWSMGTGREGSGGGGDPAAPDPSALAMPGPTRGLPPALAPAELQESPGGCARSAPRRDWGGGAPLPPES